jgi:hypothetical protein
VTAPSPFAGAGRIGNKSRVPGLSYG